MLVFDYSGVAIAAITGHDRELSGTPAQNEDMARHVIFTTILKYKKKFSQYASEIVIAGDGTQYWRQDIFPHYKGTRGRDRDSSGIDWEQISHLKNMIFNEIHEVFPYTVIKHPRAEADDVIAVMAEDVCSQRLVRQGVMEDVERCVIVSDDMDFLQLYKHSHVRQFSPKKGIFLKLDCTPKEFLRRKICSGDSGDGIPNIFNPNTVLMDRIRQKPATMKKMSPIIESSMMLDGTTDPEIQKRIIENTKLISFGAIPKNIRSEIVQQYNNGSPGSLSKLYEHMGTKGMKYLINEIDDFRI